MRISVERSTSFLVELVRDRIPFSVRYDDDAIIVSDIGEGNLERSDETKGCGKKS